MKKRIFFYTALLIVLTVSVAGFVYLRSTLFSNHLKRLILPELSALTGRQVTAGRIYLNPFPLYIGIDELSFSDNKGKEILTVKKGFVYIRLSGLISRELQLPTIQMYDVSVNASLEEAILPLLPLKKETGKSKKGLRIKPVEIVLNGGNIYLHDKKTAIEVNDPAVRYNVQKGIIRIEHSRFSYHYGEDKKKSIEAVIKGEIVVSGTEVRFKQIVFRDKHSEISFSGIYRDGKVEGSTNSRVHLKTVTELMGKPYKGDDEIKVKGAIKTGRIENKGIKEILSGLSFDLFLKGSIQLETLMSLIEEEVPLRGRVFFSGQLKGTLQNPVLKLNAFMKKGHIYGTDPDEIKCKVSFEKGLLRFYDSKVKAYNGEAAVEVKVELPGADWYSISIVAEDLDSRPILRLIEWDPGLPSGRITGYLFSSGDRFSPFGKFYFTSSRKGDGQSVLNNIKKIEGGFSFSEPLLRLSQLKVLSDDTVMTGAGSVDLNTKRISMSVAIETENIGDLFGNKQLRGKGEFKGKLEGIEPELLLKGRLRAEGVQYKNYPLGNIKAEISYKRGIVELKAFEGFLDHGRYFVKGVVDTGSEDLFVIDSPTFDLAVRITSISADWILKAGGIETGQRLDGVISGELEIKGPMNSPVGKGRLEVDNLTFSGYRIGSLKTEFEIGNERIKLSKLVLHKGRSLIKGRVELSFAGEISTEDLSFRIYSEDLPFENPYKMAIRGTVNLTGNLKNPVGALEGVILAENEKRLGGFEIGLKERILSLRSGILDGLLTIEGELSLSEPSSWSLKIVAAEGRYDKLFKPLFKDVPEDFRLDMAASATLSAKDGEVTGWIGVKRVGLSIYGYHFVNRADMLFEIDGNRIQIKQFQMKAGPASFGVQGEVNIHKGYDLTVFGSSYLAPLKGLIPSIEYIKGEVEFVLGITGDWKDPTLNGGIILKDTTVAFKGITERLRSVNGYAYIDENRLILESLSGSFSSGMINVRGSGYFSNWRFRRYHLDAMLKKVTIRATEGVWLKTSGQLSLSEQKDTVLLIGDMKVTEGRFTKDINWRQWLLSKKRSYSLAGGRAMERVELNVTFYGDENILIQNNLVRSPAKIDIILRGTLARPVILGRLELMGGKFFFRNHEFTIMNASADFVDPEGINPFFDIVARTKVREYRITLSLSGYVDEFNLSLVSDPPLDEMDILSLLAVGRLSSELKGLEGGIGASEATAFLTGQLQETLQERIQSITGFDRVEVEPYVSETSGTIGPRVTVSKRLLSDRLYVTYSTSIGGSTEQFLRLEFLLSDSVSLVGERDVAGALGADIKFRLEFK